MFILILSVGNIGCCHCVSAAAAILQKVGKPNIKLQMVGTDFCTLRCNRDSPKLPT